MGKHKKSKNDGSRGALMILAVLLVIAVLGVAGYTGKIFVDQKKVENPASQSKSQNTTVASANSQKDEKKIQQVEDNKKEDNKKEDIQPKVEEKKTVEETNLSDEDKAIDLAKKQYGSQTGVYFRIEQIQSNNIYIVSVRDNETTRDLAWYTIDVKTGTVK